MELCPYCRSKAPVMIVKKNTSALSDVQCMKCKKSYKLEIGDVDQELQKAYRETLDGLEQENAAMHAELAKRIEESVEFVLKVAEKFTGTTSDQMRKWDPAVRAQVRQEMNAAIARVKAIWGDGEPQGSETGRTMISQFIISAQGVIALLDCEEVGPTGTSKAALADGDFSKMSLIDQIKHQQAHPQPMHKRGGLPEGAEVMDPREWAWTR